MKLSTKILALKSARTVFDIMIILLSVYFIYNTYLTVSRLTVMSKTSVKGIVLAKAKPIKMHSTDDFEIKSKVKDIKIKPFVEFYNLIIPMSDPGNKSWIIIYTIFSLLAVYLSQLFFIFVLFQIRNIVNSVIKAINQESKHPFKHNVFTIKNIHRLKYIAIGFIILPIVELLLHVLDTYFIDKYFKLEGYILTTRIRLAELSWDYILIGIFFIVFIEVISRGITIQEENDFTV